MTNAQFGLTRCGEILDEIIKENKTTARKCRSFFHSSCYVLNELKTKRIDMSARNILRLAYLEQRQRQIDDDLTLHGFSPEVTLDIKKRLKYVIRFHANN